MSGSVLDERTENSTPPVNYPSPKNFYAFVPFACAQYGAHFCVKIVAQAQAEYVRVDEKSKNKPKSSRARSEVHAAVSEEQEQDNAWETISEAPLLVMTAVHNAVGNLVELRFDRCIPIPVMLVKVILMTLPYQPHLSKLTVQRTPLSPAIIHEFSKFMSQLTELCLDGSPLAGRNYNLLLERPSGLYYLSLARCKLDDEDCAQLAALLTPPCPAASSLHVLQLASNKISDEGARAFAHTLRSNRGLHYLNLAGNLITDSGAISIFNSLMEFPLTKDETREKSLRHFNFIKKKAEVYANIVKELAQDKSTLDVRINKRIKPIRIGKTEMSTADTIHQRAQAMTERQVGTFTDPFTNDKTVYRDKNLYCVGNMALCSLNLAYNNLQFPSLRCLYEVLSQQSYLRSQARSEPGLLRVRLDGNYLPRECEELLCIDKLLERAATRAAHLNLDGGGGKAVRGLAGKSRFAGLALTLEGHKLPSA